MQRVHITEYHQEGAERFRRFDGRPDVSFEREPGPGIVDWTLAASLIGILLWLGYKATGVDLYRMLQIVWGV